MPVDRPTFSESWYRVANLRPRLRSTVQTFRQHYRGRMWHVLQDPSSNQYFRLNEAAYRFVAMLDGRRTVADVWRTCSEQLGDDAPTQGEAITLLGQLYTSNLLQAELPPDAEGLFARYRKRVGREVKGYLSNLLFLRIPLFDPDRVLDKWVGVFGKVFTWYGLAVWIGLLIAAFYSLAGRWDELAHRSNQIFNPSALPLLYASFVLIKVFHEFGHGFACKKFGLQEGSGGEVHTMGVMLLVFTPLPYVDASSAWAFRSKWRRVVTGASGMFVELGVAAIAAVIWSRTGNEIVRGITFNVMFIASVSSLLFNGNPLLRYDGYYILSDLVEIPNLAQRSKNYLYYLVRRYLWSVRRAQNPAHGGGEKAWFVFYGIASTIYRIFIFSMILLFVHQRLPEALKAVALSFAAVAAFMWLAVPLGKFVHYLATNNELARTRGRAVAMVAAVAVAIVAGVGLIPAPNRERAEGTVEPVRLAFVHTAEGGFVRHVRPDHVGGGPVRVRPDDEAPLLRMENPRLEAEHGRLLARRRELRVELDKALAPPADPAGAQVARIQLAALAEKIEALEERLANLEIRPPVAGVWIAPDLEHAVGAYLPAGERVGMVASTEDVFVHAAAGQEEAAVLIAASEAGELDLEMRVRGRPEQRLGWRAVEIDPAGKVVLPSAALGYAGGGPLAVDPTDPSGTRAARPYFSVRVYPDRESAVRLRPGQRVVVRFEMPPEPLIFQWRRVFMRLLQRRSEGGPTGGRGGRGR